MAISALEGLTAAVKGRVVDRGDSGYDEARALYNGMIDKHPAAIAYCVDEADVSAAIGFARAAGFTGVYTYDIVTFGGSRFGRFCAQAHNAGLLCAPSVGPGYDAVRADGDGQLKPRRNGATYDAMWSAALRASPDVVTITSYNEWGEGTQIEPARPNKGYSSYDGAWGLTGAAAQTAYLTRTAYWAARYHALP